MFNFLLLSRCFVLTRLVNIWCEISNKCLYNLICVTYLAPCPLLDLDDGTVRQHKGQKGSVAVLECADGYTLSGSPLRTCLTSGEWSGTAPECKSRKLLILIFLN